MSPLQHQFFSREKIIFFSNFFHKIVPFCRSTQFTDWAGLGPTQVVGSRSRRTLGIGLSQSLQGARNMLLVWLVLDSPLSQCQRSAQETRCP